MNKQRLEQMVVMLSALPPEEREDFNMSAWRCGTTACAVGHACVEPVFINQGLAYNVQTGEPVFGEIESWMAVEEFFDLSGLESEWLFGDWHYPNGDDTIASEVASRISEFLLSDGSSCPLEDF